MKRKVKKQAIHSQMNRSDILEHSTSVRLTSSFVFEDAEDMYASFTEEKQLNTILHRFHVNLSEDLIQAVAAFKDNKAFIEVGIEWCIIQSKELMKFGIPFLNYYYAFGKSDNI